MNTMYAAQRRLHWLGVCIAALAGGAAIEYVIGGPRPGVAVSIAEWWGAIIGMTLFLASIPALVALCTRFQRPRLVFLTWLPIALVAMIGAVMVGQQRQNKLAGPRQVSPMASTATSTSAPSTAISDEVVWDDELAGHDATVEQARWAFDADAFYRTHPAIGLGNNTPLMQEKINAVARPGMTNHAMLELAYNAAHADARWTAATH